jgi:hypothetical protein
MLGTCCINVYSTDDVRSKLLDCAHKPTKVALSGLNDVDGIDSVTFYSNGTYEFQYKDDVLEKRGTYMGVRIGVNCSGVRCGNMNDVESTGRVFTQIGVA